MNGHASSRQYIFFLEKKDALNTFNVLKSKTIALQMMPKWISGENQIYLIDDKWNLKFRSLRVEMIHEGECFTEWRAGNWKPPDTSRDALTNWSRGSLWIYYFLLFRTRLRVWSGWRIQKYIFFEEGMLPPLFCIMPSHALRTKERG